MRVARFPGSCRKNSTSIIKLVRSCSAIATLGLKRYGNGNSIIIKIEFMWRERYHPSPSPSPPALPSPSPKIRMAGRARGANVLRVGLGGLTYYG